MQIVLNTLQTDSGDQPGSDCLSQKQKIKGAWELGPSRPLPAVGCTQARPEGPRWGGRSDAGSPLSASYVRLFSIQPLPQPGLAPTSPPCSRAPANGYFLVFLRCSLRAPFWPGGDTGVRDACAPGHGYLERTTSRYLGKPRIMNAALAGWSETPPRTFPNWKAKTPNRLGVSGALVSKLRQ